MSSTQDRTTQSATPHGDGGIDHHPADQRSRVQSASRSPPSLDAIPNLQAMSAQAAKALQKQQGDIDRIFGIVGRMEGEMNNFRLHLEGMGRELQARLPLPPPPPLSQEGLSMDELELFTRNLTRVGQKAHEVDGLKLELELMKRRIKQLEGSKVANLIGSSGLPASSPQIPDPAFQRPQPGPGEPPHGSWGAGAAQQPQANSNSAKRKTLEGLRLIEDLWNQSGDGSHPEAGTANKRPRTSTDDYPRPSPGHGPGPPAQTHPFYGPMNENHRWVPPPTPRNGPNMPPAPSQPLPPGHHGYMSPYHVGGPIPPQPSGPTNHPLQTPSSADGGSTRGTRGTRGRARGRGSRPRGRPPLGTRSEPQWERPTWSIGLAPNSPLTPVPQSIPVRELRRDIEEERVRNEEGFLLTKSGKPDMRGEAVRRRHAKRRAQREQEENAAQDAAVQRAKEFRQAAEDTLRAGQGLSGTDLDRHSRIMAQVFPNGLDEHRRRANLSNHVFPNREAAKTTVGGQTDGATDTADGPAASGANGASKEGKDVEGEQENSAEVEVKRDEDEAIEVDEDDGEDGEGYDEEDEVVDEEGPDEPDTPYEDAESS
ncbi:MAG: hypothetical protein M1819_004920 [Sarea resinae]|nr:MAG: hypothetical protein M1819_004920 [Sarea resinae]